MSANSKIEWTTHTFNIAWGCVKASAGCDHCYAETLAKRYGWGWGPGAERRTLSAAYWKQPLKWDKDARKDGVRPRVFCSSMTDVFLNDATIDAERKKLWPLIRATPHLDWQILTKHPERIAPNLPADWGTGYPNVWLGVSVENDAAAWRIGMLQRVPAVVRFLSCEPFIGEMDLRGKLHGIAWVIIGGESGGGARPMPMDPAMRLVAACQAANVSVHVKQLGAVWSREHGAAAHDPKGGDWDRWPSSLKLREYPAW